MVCWHSSRLGFVVLGQTWPNGRLNEFHLAWVHVEPSPLATLLALKNSGINQQAEMMADGRLRFAKNTGEVTGASLTRASDNTD